MDRSVPSGGDNDGQTLQRVIVLVASTLRAVHGIESAPGPEDYGVERDAEPWQRHWNQRRTDREQFELPLGDPDQARYRDVVVRVSVKVGRGLEVPLVGMWCPDAREQAEARLVTYIAFTIASIHEQAKFIRSERNLVRRSVALTNDRGIPCGPLRILPVTAGEYVSDRIEFEIEAADASLRRGVHRICGGYTPLTKISAGHFERTQQLRRRLRDAFSRYEATCAIEAVLLASLRNAGIADAEILDAMRQPGDRKSSVMSPSGQTFILEWVNGVVESHVSFGSNITSRHGSIFLADSSRCFDDGDIGKPLADLFPDLPLPSGPKVTNGVNRESGEVRIDFQNAIHPANPETGFIGEKFLVERARYADA